jgi:predicted amidohydrolase
MRVAVIQHVSRANRSEDVAALTESVAAAAEGGADAIILPAPDTPFAGDEYELIAAAAAGRCVVAAVTRDAGLLVGLEDLGPVVTLVGDDCFDRSRWRAAGAAGAHTLILSPQCESDLQAEAALEVAIALSDAVAGLVIVVEYSGSEAGAAGHGGSAVVVLGEVVAEALGEDDTLMVDLVVPVPLPEPPEPLPILPTLISQRLALRAGRRPEVDYPADLSVGRLAR